MSVTAQATQSNLVKRLRSMSGNQSDEGYSLLKHDDSEPVIEIFKGSKNFWRLRRNIDLNFIYHAKHDCIEVVGYDPSKETLAPRVYLSASILSKKCKGTQTFQDKVDNKKGDLKKKPLLDSAPYPVLEANLLAELSRDWISQHILQRLDITDTTPAPVPIPVEPQPQLDTGDEEDDMDHEVEPRPVQYYPVVDSFEIKFQPIGSDLVLPEVKAPPAKRSTRAARGSFNRERSGSFARDRSGSDAGESGDEVEMPQGRSSFTLTAAPAAPTLEWILPKKPEELEPHLIPRRKKTSTSDFLSTLSMLQQDQASLEKANKEAERRLKLTKMATDSFNSVMNRYMNKRKFLAKCSPARVRWINAINRVLTQNLVAALTKRIEKIPAHKFKTPPPPAAGAVALTSTSVTGARAAPLKALPTHSTKAQGFQPSMEAIEGSPRHTPRSPLVMNGKVTESAEDPFSAAPSPRSTGVTGPTGGIMANSGGMLDSPQQKGKKKLPPKSSITKAGKGGK